MLLAPLKILGMALSDTSKKLNKPITEDCLFFWLS